MTLRPRTARLASSVGLLAITATVAGACFGNHPFDEHVECVEDEDCSQLDDDRDPCTGYKCERDVCVPAERIARDEGCECLTSTDCLAYGSADCLGWECVDATCEPVPLPPPDDDNICTVDRCDANDEGTHEPAPDGTTCDVFGSCTSGVCSGGCPGLVDETCDPEKSNDEYLLAIDHGGLIQSVCDGIGGDDIDWMTFFGDDDTFSKDIFRATVTSDAEEVELCAYAHCTSGGAEVGTANGAPVMGAPGPGYCWTGDPATIDPYWDMRCDIPDDSATFYVSIRATKTAACTRYDMTASY